MFFFIQGKVLQVAYAKGWSLCYHWNGTLVSFIPILIHICPTPRRHASVLLSSLIMFTTSPTKIWPPVSWVYHWLSCTEQLCDCWWKQMGERANAESLQWSQTVKLHFFSELIYHQQLYAAATQRYSTFVFLTLCWIWLLFFHWILFLFTDWTRKIYKEGDNK